MANVLYLEGAHDGMSVADFKRWFSSLNDTDLLKVINEGLKPNRYGLMVFNSEKNLREAIQYFWGDDVLNVLRHFNINPSDFDSEFIFIDPYCEDIYCYNSADLECFIEDYFGDWDRFANDALHIQLSEEE